jgi:hypothetical protein
VRAWRRAGIPAPTASRGLEGGRLLLYFPDADLCCGAAEAESRGFFDVHNCPPWGTWIGFFADEGVPDDAYASYLVAWVPGELLGLASRGIEVNPEACIAWLDEAEVSLRFLLADAKRP